MYFTLLRVEGRIILSNPEIMGEKIHFDDSTLYILTKGSFRKRRRRASETRIMDLVTLIEKGQRGLIVAPPRTGKTVHRKIANRHRKTIRRFI